MLYSFSVFFFVAVFLQKQQRKIRLVSQQVLHNDMTDNFVFRRSRRLLVADLTTRDVQPLNGGFMQL